MRAADIDLLRCPATGSQLSLTESEFDGGRIRTGILAAADGKHRYPIRNFIPRFVPETNYADSFGLQWNRFRRTQLDSNSGVPISRDRFYRYSGWTPGELRGKRILEVGCGAGRFTEVALDAGAEVVALDYSEAVDACFENHGHRPNLTVVQGDVYRLPFSPGSFDYVFCLGVLQHTPDVRDAFAALPRQLRPGGKLVVDVYPKLRSNVLWPKYWLRPLTKRLPAAKLFSVVESAAPKLLPLSRAIAKFPVIGRKLRYFVPVADYSGVYPLSEKQLEEWAVLDTFDMLSPAYDSPQTEDTLRSWFQDAGLSNVEVFRDGFIVGRGERR